MILTMSLVAFHVFATNTSSTEEMELSDDESRREYLIDFLKTKGNRNLEAFFKEKLKYFSLEEFDDFLSQTSLKNDENGGQHDRNYLALQAYETLKLQPIGAFIVRPSNMPTNNKFAVRTISVRVSKEHFKKTQKMHPHDETPVLHYRIYQFYDDNRYCVAVNEKGTNKICSGRFSEIGKGEAVVFSSIVDVFNYATKESPLILDEFLPILLSR